MKERSKQSVYNRRKKFAAQPSAVALSPRTNSGLCRSSLLPGVGSDFGIPCQADMNRLQRDLAD
jgi:hypothetical protein